MENIAAVKQLSLLPELDINYINEFFSYLGLAIYYNRLDIVEVLLAHPDLDINAVMPGKGCALLYAINQGVDTKIIDAILQHPNLNPGLMLFTFVKKGCTELALKLIKHPNINLLLEQPFGWGETIFHVACEQGLLEVVKELWQNPLIKDHLQKNNGENMFIYEGKKAGFTPLMLAAWGNHVKVYNYLIEQEFSDHPVLIGASNLSIFYQTQKCPPCLPSDFKHWMNNQEKVIDSNRNLLLVSPREFFNLHHLKKIRGSLIAGAYTSVSLFALPMPEDHNQAALLTGGKLSVG